MPKQRPASPGKQGEDGLLDLWIRPQMTVDVQMRKGPPELGRIGSGLSVPIELCKLVPRHTDNLHRFFDGRLDWLWKRVAGGKDNP